MKISDNLKSLFTAKIEERDDQPVIRIPEQEIQLDNLSVDDTYRVAVFQEPEQQENSKAPSSIRTQSRPDDRQHMPESSEPPVSEGDQLEVEIQGLGDQGDGIARVGAGYVIFVSDVNVGDHVTVEVTDTRESFGFAKVITPEPVTG